MIVFSYHDYLACKKFISLHSYILNEDSYIYSLEQNSNIHNIHDTLYRDLLNDEKEMCLFLKNFIDYDFSYDEINKYNRDFVTTEFKNRYADIVYKLKNAPIYILIEHQSYIDNSISYRIFEYYSEILRDTINKDKLHRKNYKIPLVIPIVFYTGNKNWDLIPNVKEKQYYSNFKDGHLDINYNFIDINDYSIDNLLQMNSYIAYIMAIDKCKSVNQLFDIINRLSSILDTSKRKEHLKRVIQYVLSVRFDETTTDKLLNKFNERNDVNMKYVWDYIREDEKRIAKKLLIQGNTQGKREGKLEIIKNMLKNGETIEKIKLYSGISKKEIEKIRDEMKLSV